MNQNARGRQPAAQNANESMAIRSDPHFVLQSFVFAHARAQRLRCAGIYLNQRGAQEFAPIPFIVVVLGDANVFKFTRKLLDRVRLGKGFDTSHRKQFAGAQKIRLNILPEQLVSCKYLAAMSALENNAALVS